MTSMVADPYLQLQSTWTLQELQDRIPGLHSMINQLQAVSLGALASFDIRGGAQIAGHRTTGDWLAKTVRTTSAAAGWRLHTARASPPGLSRAGAPLHRPPHPHWTDRGPTDLPNLVLLCRFHHRQIHHGRLHITQTPTGRHTTETRPPPDTG